MSARTKKTVAILGMVTAAAMGFLARPAAASSIEVGGAYWDTKDADQASGVMTKLTFGNFVELRGAYFSDVTTNTGANDFKIRAIPAEAGLAWHFVPDAPFSPYIGGGASYYFLNTNRGQIDDEVGYYAVAGADFGRLPSGLSFNVEAIYRNVNATVRENQHGLPSDTVDRVRLDLTGFGANAGLVWRF